MTPVPQKILVVDDSELLHRMYDLVLSRYRYKGSEILHARNGQEALTLLKQDRDIDLVLLDVNMPVMTGPQLLTALNAARMMSSLKVIMISTEGRELEVRKALLDGAAGYVTKPFKPNDLHALIDRLFQISPDVFASGGM